MTRCQLFLLSMCWGSRRRVIARWGGGGDELEEALVAVWMELLTDEALAVEAQQAVDGENMDLEWAEVDQAWEWPVTDRTKSNISFWSLPPKPELLLAKVLL